MPYKYTKTVEGIVDGSIDNRIVTYKNPYPFNVGLPFYCEQNTTGFYDITYDLVPEETSTNYCESTREFCVITQVIDKTNIQIPTFLPTDSALWLDADDSSTLTLVSGAVSEWRDKSGNNRHATQGTAGNRPLLVSGGLNGTDVVRLDGSNDFLSLIPITNTNIRTVFLVAKKRLTNSRMMLLSNTGNTLDFASTYWNDLKIYASGSGYYVYIDNLGGIDTPYISSESFNNATANLWRNGSALSPLTTITGSNQNIFNEIGRRLGTNEYSDGDISQIIIFPRVLTQAEREEMEGYLAWSTGLQGILPTGHPYKSSYTGVTVTETTVCTDFYDFAQAP